ncbi:hypothetical protein XU18_0414 [Perkinsela sp. CCAP 1560/4]|nr:hypothetical protein XU18_0414 [Perkinsela sp. CCAP 1560/4]|eukprot:KNH09729.1 hypothetical protein XU18_0414 [Perkinsela sp. CCAP 1560/4]
MQSSQHSNIELYANIIESPHSAEEWKRGPGDKPIWGRVGTSDLQLSNGGSEKYHFSKVIQNATSNDLYTQTGLKTMVGRAITGINVSLISVGMPQTFNNCEQVEREEKAQFLTLAQEILKTIVNAPERRERYCAASVVQIDPAGRIHPFDDSLYGCIGDASGYKERVKMPFGLWHGDHGIVLPPEIFQEMCCQQDIDHFFTIHRVSVPSQGLKSGVELVSMDNFRRGMQESSQAETSQRSTHPHANDVVSAEAALMFVAEIFQSVSKGHDMRSTVVLLYVPQRAERSITKHLWTSFENLLEHGKLTHSEASSNAVVSLELHPISNICQHILYGGGLCAAIFHIPREERNLSHTLSILRHTKLLRAAKLLMPINYYHMPTCANGAITQFHQFQKGIKRDLSSAFAAGMYDGWKVGLKSAIKVVEDRIKQMRLLSRFYLAKTRDSVLLRYEVICQNLQTEYQTRKQVKLEQSKAHEESERVLECKSRRQAQIDSIISERSAQKEEITMLTDRIEEKRLEIEEIREQKRDYVAKFQSEIAELMRNLEQVNSETEFFISEIQTIQKGDQQATKEHKIIFQLDYIEQVEVKRQEKDALLEKLRHLVSSVSTNDQGDSPDSSDPVMREIKEISSAVTKKEQELAVIEAQIAVLEKSFAQRHAQTNINAPKDPGTPGELSRFLSPGNPILPEENERGDCAALRNISLLIEQSPFDPHRLKKRDLPNISEHPASPQTPINRVVKGVQAVPRRVSRVATPSLSSSRTGMTISLPPKRGSEKKSEDVVKLTPTPISSRLRSSTSEYTLSAHPKTKRDQNVKSSNLPRVASLSTTKDAVRKLPNDATRVRKSTKKIHVRSSGKGVKSIGKPTAAKAVDKNEKSTTVLRSARATPSPEPKRSSLKKKSGESQKSHLSTETKTPNNKNLAKPPAKDQKAGNIPSKTDRLTTPSKQAVDSSGRVVTKSLVYQKLSKLAQNGSRKRDIASKDPIEKSAENPEKYLKSSGSKDSSGVVVFRKSATPRSSVILSPVHDKPVAKDASTGRKLVSLQRDDSPGKLPSVGAMIRNFISSGTNVIQRTVKPRVLDFADKSELFSFLHSDNSISPVAEEEEGQQSAKNSRHSHNTSKKRHGQKK